MDAARTALLFLLVIIHLGLTLWVFRDATANKRDSFLWCCAMLFYGLIAAGVYLLTRSHKTAEFVEPLSKPQLRNLKWFGALATVLGAGVILFGFLNDKHFGEQVGARTALLGIGWNVLIVGLLCLGMALLKLNTDLLSPCGRMSRDRFLTIVLPLLFVSFIVDLLLVLPNWETDVKTAGIFIVGFKGGLIIIFTGFQVVKRLHDLGLSGYYFCASFIPAYNIYLYLMVFFQAGNECRNEFGVQPY